jgi:hypothetical protein
MSWNIPTWKIEAMDALRRAMPGTTCSVQRQRLRAALAKFAITSYEAMRYLDIYDPRARVMELRRDGDRIHRHWWTIATESGDWHRVGLYVLDGSGL